MIDIIWSNGPATDYYTEWNMIWFNVQHSVSLSPHMLFEKKQQNYKLHEYFKYQLQMFLTPKKICC